MSSNHLVAIPAPFYEAVLCEAESDFSSDEFMAALQRVSRRKTLVERADDGMLNIRETGGVDLDDLKKDLGL